MWAFLMAIVRLVLKFKVKPNHFAHRHAQYAQHIRAFNVENDVIRI